MMAEYAIDDVSCDELPRGILVGTVELHDVELYDCDGGDWKLRNREREETPLKSANHPQLVWFNPF